MQEPVLSLARDDAGALWAGTTTDLVRVAGGAPGRVPVGEAVTALARDGGGRLWAGTFQRVVSLDTDSPGEARVRPLAETNRELRVMGMGADRDGTVWLATRGSGLAQLAPFAATGVHNLGRKEGLDDVAFAALEVRDGTMWLTTPRGLTRWTKDGPADVPLPAGAPARDLRSLAEAPDGAVWISARRHGLLRARPGGGVETLALPQARGREVRGVFVDAGGDAWVGWEEGGAVRYAGGDPARALEVGADQGLCPGPIVMFGRRRAGGLWVAGPGGLGLLTAGGAAGGGVRVRCHTARDGLPSDSVGAFHEDPDGTLWIATDRGIARLRGGRFTGVQLSLDAQGARQAGTPGLMFSLVDDGRGHFWATSVVGVLRVARAALEDALQAGRPTVVAAVLDARTGMRSAECISGYRPAARLDGAGRLWVPTLGGITLFRTAAAAPAPVQPALESATARGGALPLASPLRLPAGGGELDVTWTAPDFLWPSELRFEHRLDGVDARLVADGARRGARYAGLGPGAYTLHVRVVDHLGRARGQRAWSVEAPPRFHQTRWFVAFCVAVALALAGGGHRLRVRALQARHRALEAERARIARDMHDGLAQGFAAIGLQLDTIDLALSPDAGARPLVQDARRMVEACREETKNAIWRIRADAPQGLTVRALVDNAVAAFTDGMPATARPRIETSVRGAARTLDGRAAHELSQILREALSNAVRHARAARIAVEALADEAGVHLLVRDDGAGLATGAGAGAAAGAGGFGLVGMQERAAQIGATVRVEPNADGRGTAVRVHLA
jgi:signal transduction histidine kinase